MKTSACFAISLTSARPFGDFKFAVTDFSVGLLVLFDDYDGLQTYLDHPLHTEYLEKHGKYWEKVPVYDFVNQKK